ncbi:MAG TPA: M20 family metallopeptidase [Candidatus Acidoferrales bacterium]|nr:M20 family metallopeptidase [Candidatus Acidoferrales bacterium]
MTSDSSLPLLHRYLRRRQAAMVKLLGELVRMESPSTDRAALDRLARFLARQWQQRGARVNLLRPRKSGPILRAEMAFGDSQAEGQLLVIGHLDTVYSLGTLKRMPFSVRAGRAYGPGTFDMKSGLVQALFAVEALQTLGLWPTKKLVFVFTSDEEVGSEAGRPVIEREARRSRAVLVLEPAAGPQGALKTARKGVGEFELEVEGRAAHAGLEPEKGVNAIEELARQIVRVKRFERPARGLTLNVDIIAGGTRTNVVADHARGVVDVRIPRLKNGAWIEQRMKSLQAVDPRAKLIVRGGINRPPLERTSDVARLFRQAQRLSQSLGLRLEEAAVGGGSDGNFTAALGIPTLDGLGGVGAGAHSPGEFVVIRRMPERAALLAGLLLTL